MAGTGTALGVAVVKFTADYKQFVQGLGAMGTSAATLGSKVTAVGTRMSSIGKAGLVAFAGLGMAIGAVIKTAADFEKGFHEVQTMMGDASSDQIATLRKDILDLSMDFGQKLPDALRASYNALSASVPEENLVSFLQVAGKAASAGVTDINTTVDALTTVVNSYGEKLAYLGDYTQRAASVSDMLFATVKGGKTTMAELAASIGTVASIAASANITLDELGAMFATMTAKGMSTAISTTAIRATIASLLTPAKEAADKFEELGINLEGFRKGEITFTELMQQVSKATKGNVVALAELFPNQRAFVGVIQMMNDGLVRFGGELDRQKDKLGSTEEAFKIMEDTLNAQINKAWATFRVLLVETGDAIGITDGLLKDLTTSLRDMVEYVRENKEQVGGLGSALLKATLYLGAFSIAMIALAKVVTTIGTLITGVQGLITAFTALAAILAAPALLPIGLTIAFGVAIGMAVVNVGLLVASIFSLRAANKELEKSKEALGVTTNRYLDQLVKEGKMTKERAAEIKQIKDEEERFAKAQVEAQMDGIARRIQGTKELIAAEEEALGRKLTLNEQRAAMERQMYEQEATDLAEHYASKAEQAANAQITEEDLTNFTAEQLAMRMESLKEQAIQQQLTGEQYLNYVNATLTGMGLERASVEELAALESFAAENKIALLDALLYKRGEVTAGEIGLINQLTVVKDTALAADQARMGIENFDYAALAESYKKFYEESIIAVNMYRDAQIDARNKIREINLLAQEEGREQTDEELEQIFTLQATYIAAGEGMKIAKENAREAQLKYAETHSQTTEVIKQKEAELATEVQRSKDIQIAAIADMMKEQEKYIAQVLKDTPQIKVAMEGMTDSQQVAFKALIGNMGVAGMDSQTASTTISKNFNAMKNAAIDLEQSIGISSEKIHGHFIKTLPETPGSPAPLDVFQNNLLTMGDALEGLVGQTDSAAGRMHGIWQSFVGGLAGIMQQAYGYLQRLNPFAVFSPSLVDNTKGGARAMLGIWDGHSGNLLRVMMKSYDAMTYLDPTARHSPSILDNVVSGYKQMSDVEKRALQDKWAMFQKVYSKQIALVKEFYEGGGSMHAVYDRDVHSNAVMGSKFISSPTGLNENDWTGMIRRLQDMMGFSNNESPHALIEMIKGLIGTTGNAPQSALTPRSGGGRGLSTPDPAQMLPGQYNGQAAQYGANTHSALINALVMQVEQAKTLTNSVAAMASYIPQLSLQTQAALTTPSDMQFSFNIGNVRSDEDIQLLAQKAASEFAKMQWRGR